MFRVLFLYEHKHLSYFFIFTLLCGASKGFMTAFKTFIKPFEVPQRSVKIKIKNLIFSLHPGLKREGLKTNPNPLNANFTKRSNTFKQFVGNLPTNCLSGFGNFVGLALKGSTYLNQVFNFHTNC